MLLKGFDSKGFRFFSHFTSRKVCRPRHHGPPLEVGTRTQYSEPPPLHSCLPCVLCRARISRATPRQPWLFTGQGSSGDGKFAWRAQWLGEGLRRVCGGNSGVVLQCHHSTSVPRQLVCTTWGVVPVPGRPTTFPTTTFTSALEMLGRYRWCHLSGATFLGHFAWPQLTALSLWVCDRVSRVLVHVHARHPGLVCGPVTSQHLLAVGRSFREPWAV